MHQMLRRNQLAMHHFVLRVAMQYLARCSHGMLVRAARVFRMRNLFHGEPLRASLRLRHVQRFLRGEFLFIDCLWHRFLLENRGGSSPPPFLLRLLVRAYSAAGRTACTSPKLVYMLRR